MGRELHVSYLTKSDPDEQALVVAAGGSYYYAKKDLKGRKLDPAVRESRLRESAGNGNGAGTVTCESNTSTMILILFVMLIIRAGKTTRIGTTIRRFHG